MIPSDIRKEIMRRLSAVERDEGVRILLAIESGSRAWGFSSPNSDFDVRFIYARSEDWYLAVDLEEKRDVIEYKIVDDIDLNGWDIRKVLRLFLRSNPVVYSLQRGIHHYRSMAKTNYRGHLRADLTPLKKYFIEPIASSKARNFLGETNK